MLCSNKSMLFTIDSTYVIFFKIICVYLLKPYGMTYK
jgi:hypothetical protein